MTFPVTILPSLSDRRYHQDSVQQSLISDLYLFAMLQLRWYNVGLSKINIKWIAKIINIQRKQRMRWNFVMELSQRWKAISHFKKSRQKWRLVFDIREFRICKAYIWIVSNFNVTHYVMTWRIYSYTIKPCHRKYIYWYMYIKTVKNIQKTIYNI